MRGRIACRLAIALLMLANAKAAQAACLDPTEFMQSTVNITRQFDDEERGTHGDVVAVRGTGWFLSTTTIVSAQHVTKAMDLSSADWKPLEIVDGRGNKQSLEARIQRIAGAQAEKLAIIELQRGKRTPGRAPAFAPAYTLAERELAFFTSSRTWLRL